MSTFAFAIRIRCVRRMFCWPTICCCCILYGKIIGWLEFEGISHAASFIQSKPILFLWWHGMRETIPIFETINEWPCLLDFFWAINWTVFKASASHLIDWAIMEMFVYSRNGLGHGISAKSDIFIFELALGITFSCSSSSSFSVEIAALHLSHLPRFVC